MIDLGPFHEHYVKISDALELTDARSLIKIDCRPNGVVFDTPQQVILVTWADLKEMSAVELARRLMRWTVGQAKQVSDTE